MVSISQGNIKMGAIPSVSLPAGETCRPCKCFDKCYARKIERLRPNVRNAYRNNMDILLSDPDTYWREVAAAVSTSRFFRFHVSGDIPDEDYFVRMLKTAWDNPHCEILCFTKKYEIVNRCLDMGMIVPPNLHILFSGWEGLPMVNPYKFPEAHVRYRNGTTTARDDAHECTGNCTECAVTGDNCWTLKPGEQVVFKEH